MRGIVYIILKLKYKTLSYCPRHVWYKRGLFHLANIKPLIGALHDYESLIPSLIQMVVSSRLSERPGSERATQIAKLAIKHRVSRVSRISRSLHNGLSSQTHSEAVASFTRLERIHLRYTTTSFVNARISLVWWTAADFFDRVPARSPRRDASLDASMRARANSTRWKLDV